MQFHELRSLVEVAARGSLRAAAEALHLSPAAVHKQLRSLQDDLGAPLYRRTGGRLTLTEEGNLILPYARSLLMQHERAIEALQEMKGLRRGVLRIGCGPTIASYLLPAMLKRYRVAFPGIDILVETGSTNQLLSRLHEGAIDLALFVEPDAEAEQQLNEYLSWEFEIVLVSSPRYRRRRCSIRTLASDTFILFKSGARVQHAIDSYFQMHAFHPRVCMRFDNADAIKAMVRSDFGLSMLPYWAVAHDLRQGAVRVLRQNEPPLLARIVLASASEIHPTRAVEAFVDLARSCDGADLDLRS